jgi:hypothetical protein
VGPGRFITTTEERPSLELDRKRPSSAALAKVAGARINLIHRPTVMSDDASAFQGGGRARRQVRILPNSLASTDNCRPSPATVATRALKMGLDIREYRPGPEPGPLLSPPPATPPVLALHAKTWWSTAGSPTSAPSTSTRSENLNTEVGASSTTRAWHPALQAVMEIDMRPENSWSARRARPVRAAHQARQVRLWQL